MADYLERQSEYKNLVIKNGGEYIDGKIDWENRVFTSSNPVRSLATYIGIYVDNNLTNSRLLRINSQISSTNLLSIFLAFSLIFFNFGNW